MYIVYESNFVINTHICYYKGKSILTWLNVRNCVINVIKTIVREHAQNTTTPAISLVAYNGISLLIGPPARALISSIMYHLGEGNRSCLFPVTGNGYGQVTKPQGYQLSSRNLSMIPYLQTTIARSTQFVE